MTPYEAAAGGVADIDTTAINVPREPEAFVDNELWVAKQNAFEWIESGQRAGEYKKGVYSCCEIHPFFAAEKAGAGYEYIQPGTIGLGQYNDYVIQDLEYNGTWRVYWGKENSNWVEMHAYGGFSWEQSNLLQAGIEASGKAEPSNGMTQEVAGVWGSPPSWHPWEAAYRKAEYVYKPSYVPICDQPSQGLTPGDASFETSSVPPC